jgi:hypothetical protein
MNKYFIKITLFKADAFKIKNIIKQRIIKGNLLIFMLYKKYFLKIINKFNESNMTMFYLMKREKCAKYTSYL